MAHIRKRTIVIPGGFIVIKVNGTDLITTVTKSRNLKMASTLSTLSATTMLLETTSRGAVISSIIIGVPIQDTIVSTILILTVINIIKKLYTAIILIIAKNLKKINIINIQIIIIMVVIIMAMAIITMQAENAEICLTWKAILSVLI